MIIEINTLKSMLILFEKFGEAVTAIHATGTGSWKMTVSESAILNMNISKPSKFSPEHRIRQALAEMDADDIFTLGDRLAVFCNNQKRGGKFQYKGDVLADALSNFATNGYANPEEDEDTEEEESEE